MRSISVNMSTGRPMGLLVRFALPLLIGNLFQQAYNLADSIIVGRFIGAGALAAVGATGSVSFLFFSVCNGISSGGGIVTAQYFGAGDDDKVRRAIVNSAYLMFSTSFFMGLLAFVLTPRVLHWMGTPADILPDSITYMRMMCLSVPLIGVYNYAASMLRALGDSKTPLYFLIVACLLNVVLDLVFVLALGMGVFGAALATMIGQLLAGVGCLAFARRSNPYFMLSRREMTVDWAIVRHAVRLGLPMALQWSMIAVSTTALQSVVNRFGTTTVAAFTATNRIDQLTQQPFGSLGMALSTFAGQNYGAGKIDRVRHGLRDGFIVMASFSGVMLVVIQLLRMSIIRVFVSEAEVIALGGRALALTSCFYIFLGTIYITRGTLNGVGDTLFSLINGGIEVLCRIFLPMGLILIPGVGVWGIWWTAGLTWGVSAAACLLRYFYWRAKRARLKASATEEAALAPR